MVRKLNKRGQRTFTISDIGTIAISLVVAAVILGMGATILSKLQDQATGNATTGTVAFNVSRFGIDGLSTIAEFLPTIAIVAVAAIVIGIILVFFGRQGT